MASFGHSASQAEQFIHETAIFSVIDRSCERRFLLHRGAVGAPRCKAYKLGLFCGNGFRLNVDRDFTRTDFRVTLFDMDDRTSLHAFEVALEVGDRGLLDKLVRELIDSLDTSREEILLRAATDLRDEDRMAVLDSADDGLESIFLTIAALAVQVDTAVTDEVGALAGAQLIDLELSRVAEVFIDAAATLGRYSDEDLDVALFASEDLKLISLGVGNCVTLVLDRSLIGLASGEIVVDVHLHDLFGGELGAAVFTEKADGVRAALTAVTHHVHFTFARILKLLQFLRGRTTLAGQTEHRAVLSGGDERHDIVQEGATRLNGLVHLFEVLVINAGDHDRVDLRENATLGEHLEALHLAIREDLGSFLAGIAFMLVEDPGIDLRTDFSIDHVHGDRDVIDIVTGDRIDVIGKGQAIRRQAKLDIGSGLGDEVEGLEGLLRVGERIAGAGNAENGHLRDRGSDRENLLGSLLGGQTLG